MKILAVDDDWITLAMLENLLFEHGHEVITAQDGREGLEKFRSEQPDLVISDIEMPHMTGLELLSEVRELNPTIFFIITTAHGSENYALQALRAGATNYLKKPVEPAELAALIEKYSALVHDRDKSTRILKFIRSTEFTMEFGNEMELLYALCEYLVGQLASKVSADERFGIHLGLYELLVNAIEHGNLGITYDEKSMAFDRPGGMEALVAERKADPLMQTRKVTLQFHMSEASCEWVIQDEGAGFDWRARTQTITPEMLTDTHGRGILITRLQFDEFEYIGNGSTVRVAKKFSTDPAERQLFAATGA